jgi:hypothetical protein
MIFRLASERCCSSLTSCVLPGRSTLHASAAHGAPLRRQPAFDSMTCWSSQGSGSGSRSDSDVGFSRRHRRGSQPSSPTKQGSWAWAGSWDDDAQLYEHPQASYYNVPAAPRHSSGMMESRFMHAAAPHWQAMLPPPAAAPVYPPYAMQMQQAALYQQSYWMAAMQSQQQLVSQVQNLSRNCFDDVTRVAFVAKRLSLMHLPMIRRSTTAAFKTATLALLEERTL